MSYTSGTCYPSIPVPCSPSLIPGIFLFPIGIFRIMSVADWVTVARGDMKIRFVWERARAPNRSSLWNACCSRAGRTLRARLCVLEYNFPAIHCTINVQCTAHCTVQIVQMMLTIIFPQHGVVSPILLRAVYHGLSGRENPDLEFGVRRLHKGHSGKREGRPNTRCVR